MSNTALVGGNGGSPFSKSCPTGSYLKMLSGTTGDNVNHLCASCSNGTILGCYGKPPSLTAPLPAGVSPYTISFDGPMNSYYMAGSTYLTKIGNYGKGSDPRTDVYCPEGTYINGIAGRSGDLIDKLGFTCSTPVFTPPPALTPTMPTVVDITPAPGLTQPPSIAIPTSMPPVSVSMPGVGPVMVNAVPTVPPSSVVDPAAAMAAAMAASANGATKTNGTAGTAKESTIKTSNTLLYIMLVVVAILLGGVAYSHLGRSRPNNMPYPNMPYPGQPYPGQPYPGQPYPGR